MVNLVLEAAQPLRAAHAVARLERHASGLKHRCCDCPRSGPLQPNIGELPGHKNLVIPIGPFAGNTIGAHPAPLHATLCKKIAKDLFGSRCFGTVAPEQGTLRGFPLSDTLYHFFSPHADGVRGGAPRIFFPLFASK